MGVLVLSQSWSSRKCSILCFCFSVFWSKPFPFGVNLSHGYSESISLGVCLVWAVLPPRGNARVCQACSEQQATPWFMLLGGWAGCLTPKICIWVVLRSNRNKFLFSLLVTPFSVLRMKAACFFLPARSVTLHVSVCWPWKSWVKLLRCPQLSFSNSSYVPSVCTSTGQWWRDSLVL